MKRWEWGIGNGEWGLGNGGWGVGTGGSEMGIREWGVGTQDNVYKKGCEKNGHHFFTALFHILYQLVRDLMGAGIFPPRLMNSSARNLLISRTGA